MSLAFTMLGLSISTANFSIGGFGWIPIVVEIGAWFCLGFSGFHSTKTRGKEVKMLLSARAIQSNLYKLKAVDEGSVETGGMKIFLNNKIDNEIGLQDKLVMEIYSEREELLRFLQAGVVYLAIGRALAAIMILP
jgi:hypothetical protein